MEIKLTDLECERVSETMFKCIAEQPSLPVWFFPLVIACFVVAVLVLILVARMTLLQGKTPDRRQVNRYVENERRSLSKERP